MQFTLKNVTLALVEGPDHPSTQNIESCLNEALVNKYSTTFDFFIRGFTIVTDWAAVMEKVAGASVSREIRVPDETWMSCIVHFLNNMMINVITNHCRTETLQVVLLDFRSMKKIIENANRAGWNHLLPKGYLLLQNQQLDLQLITKLLKCS